jgi:hypothetical protein
MANIKTQTSLLNDTVDSSYLHTTNVKTKCIQSTSAMRSVYPGVSHNNVEFDNQCKKIYLSGQKSTISAHNLLMNYKQSTSITNDNNGYGIFDNDPAADFDIKSRIQD